MNKSVKNEWFESWFDSKFYHLLYNNRDEQEAENFISKLVHHLDLEPQSSILDLGCGKGRHANQLNKNEYQVHGIDLSKESIDYANKKYSNASLQFFQGDMRENFGSSEYNCVMNLFTSFGYFEEFTENEKAINNVVNALKPKGIFVQDFLNAQWVKDTLIESERQKRGDITFHISRKIEKGYVKKSIDFIVKGKVHSFQEKVRLLNLADFKAIYKSQGLEIIETFGSYELDEFDVHKSNRLILISQGK